MVDAFVGTWNIVDTKNFDEYMKAIGECAVKISMSRSVLIVKYALMNRSDKYLCIMYHNIIVLNFH